MYLHHTLIHVAIIGLLSSSAAFANCGSSACAINTNWDEHSASQPGLSLDLRHSYTKADQLRSGTNKIAADTTFAGEVENLRTITHITTLTADYTLDKNFGVTVQLPYVSRDHAHNLGPYVGAVSAGQETFKANSLGDAKLIARYRTTLNEEERASIGFKAGLKLATGRKDFTLDTGVIPNEVALQPGNGSTDFIVGALWSMATPGSAASWFAQASYQSSIKHDASFRPGDTLNVDGGLRYNFGSGLNGLLQLNAQSSAADDLNGTAIGGGKTVSLTPGVSYSVMTNTNVYGLLQLPIYQSVTGEQLTASNSLTVGINHRY